MIGVVEIRVQENNETTLVHREGTIFLFPQVHRAFQGVLRMETGPDWTGWRAEGLQTKWKIRA